MKIGLIGAPQSGKTTLGAMLYAEFLREGSEGAYLIPEYAKYWIASGHTIRDCGEQEHVGHSQMCQETAIMQTTFSPIICDSVLFLGKIYAKHAGYCTNAEFSSYIKEVEKFKYDVIIHTPLVFASNEKCEFRIHDARESLHIASLIEEELKQHKNVIRAPNVFEDRDNFVKKFVKDYRKDYLNGSANQSKIG